MGPKIKCQTLALRYRQVENFQETEWSAMTALEEDLLRLETELGDQFGGTNTCIRVQVDRVSITVYLVIFAMV